MAALKDQEQTVLANITIQAFTKWLQETGGKLPNLSHQLVVTPFTYSNNKFEQLLIVLVGGRWVYAVVSLWLAQIVGQVTSALFWKLAYLVQTILWMKS